MNEILDELRIFDAAVRKIWDQYQAGGPGQVDSQWFPAVATSAERLADLLVERSDIAAAQQDAFAEGDRRQLRAAVAAATRLARRCACDAAGLCFVTGEAGLIPRRDLFDEFTNALRIIGQVCQSQWPQPRF